MAVQYKFFIIPVKQSEAEMELNAFLKSRRVVHIQREFVAAGENSFWSMAVEYLDREKTADVSIGRRRVDYREVLKPADFEVFAKLREWRKTVAEKEGMALFTILTNDQLAQIAEKRAASKEDLKAIDGIGESRIKKYGDQLLEIVAAITQSQHKQDHHETRREPVSADS